MFLVELGLTVDSTTNVFHFSTCRAENLTVDAGSLAFISAQVTALSQEIIATVTKVGGATQIGNFAITNTGLL